MFLPFPNGSEINFALSATKRLRDERMVFLVLCQIVDDRFEAEQVNELRVAGIRNEVHFGWWRLGRWDL